MIPVPTGNKRELLDFTLELIDHCRVSVGMRSAQCQMLHTICETGRYDGSKSLINTLYKHLDRTQAHLFSPVELKFTLDFERAYPKRIYQQADVVGRVITRQWDRNNTDMRFAQGVFESLKYGACIHKQWVQSEGEDQHPAYYDKLVLPWQFGVYNESENNINSQPALCETTQITLPEVWRRIHHLPDAKKLYERIKSHCSSSGKVTSPDSFFHQVLSSSQLNTSGVQGGASTWGGVVNVSNTANYSVLGPQVSAPMVTVHELWVQDETDYTTIITIEPDVIIAPLYKKANLLIKDSQLQPYRLIQPNQVTNWFWGRSEMVDLIEPQRLLSMWCDDAQRLWGLQVDKLLAFIGDNNIKDEQYGAFRNAGYMSLGPNSDVKDVTPKFPGETLPMIKFIIETINTLGGYPPIMQGQGEPGVRAGSHASTLMKTGSPTLRDRALIVERQAAICADLTASIREAKDDKFYWLKADEPIKDVEETSFLLSQLPEDWRVQVDSHSSSPIFSDENSQLVAAAMKMGVVDGEYFINNTPLPDKETALTALREKQKKQAEQMQQLLKQFPEAGEKLAIKQMTGGRR